MNSHRKGTSVPEKQTSKEEIKKQNIKTRKLQATVIAVSAVVALLPFFLITRNIGRPLNQAGGVYTILFFSNLFILYPITMVIYKNRLSMAKRNAQRYGS